MSDDEALLRAVLAAPADDAPRLIYADWLEEHGQGDLAGQIRSGVAQPGGRVWARHALPNGIVCRVIVHRGFPEAVALPATALLAHAAELFGKFPLTDVRLTDKAPAQFPGGRWVWFFVRTEPSGPSDLPIAIRPPGAGDLARFDSEDAAQQAASVWCVEYGRAVAGLPVIAFGSE